jgi:hypothetical protein
MELYKQIEKIKTKEDLSSFIISLKDDLKSNPDQWENITLDSFLSAMGDWVSSMDNYYKNSGQQPTETPSWRTIADILYASKIYE